MYVRSPCFAAMVAVVVVDAVLPSCRWTVPIALTAGNCVILKPSEKVPLTMRRVAQLLTEAG